MKSLYVLAAVCILGALGLSTLVIAHTDVHMHVSTEPAHPHTGEQTLLSVSLDEIDLRICDCTLSIHEGDSEILRVPLAAKEVRVSTPISIVFVSEGIYDITVSGSPKTDGSFVPFTSTEHVRVGSPITQHATVIAIIRYSLLIGAILLAGFVMWRERKALRILK